MPKLIGLTGDVAKTRERERERKKTKEEEEEEEKKEEEKKIGPTLVRAGLIPGAIMKGLFLKRRPTFCTHFQLLFSPLHLHNLLPIMIFENFLLFCELHWPVPYPAVWFSFYFQVERKDMDI